MKALFSHWSKPGLYRKGLHWASERDQAVAWHLSSALAKKYVGSTCLVTDAHGAEYAQSIGVEYDEVRVELDRINHIDYRYWSYGKIQALKLFEEPVVHLDHDLFVLQPWPTIVTDLAFDYEEAHGMLGFYGSVAEVMEQDPQVRAGRRPYWLGLSKTAFNCGVIAVSGTPRSLLWLRTFYVAAEDFLEGAHKHMAKRTVRQAGGFSAMILEQQIAADIAYHRECTISFLHHADLYRHYLSHHKRSPEAVHWMNDQLQRRFPRLYTLIQERYGDCS